MRIYSSSSSIHQQEEEDWDYSVPVHYPNDSDDSFELGDLQALEGELYSNTSIVDDEAPLLRFARQAPSSHQEEGRCPTFITTTQTKEERPESLFYQTYDEISPPRAQPQQQQPQAACPNPSFTSCGGGSPLMEASTDNEKNGAEDVIITTTTPPTMSPSTQRNACINKTPRTNNKKKMKKKKKKTTHLHLSTIPPPSCPLSFHLLLSDTKEETRHTSPTSIVDIFQDLESLSNEIIQTSSSTSTSIASTTLGSLDTPTRQPCSSHDEGPYYKDDAEECKQVDDAFAFDGHQKETNVIRGISAKYTNEYHQHHNVNDDDETSAVEECKDDASNQERRTMMAREGALARKKNHDEKKDKQHHDDGIMDKEVGDGYKQNRRHDNQKTIVIENGGEKVYEWTHNHKNAAQAMTTTTPFVIANGGKAVFHYEIINHNDDDKYCVFADHCPTASLY